MDVEKGPIDPELSNSSNVEVLSDASSKNQKSETIKEGIANAEIVIGSKDTAAQDRLTGWKLHALTIAFVSFPADSKKKTEFLLVEFASAFFFHLLKPRL